MPYYTSINTFPLFINKFSPRRLDLLTFLTGEGGFGKVIFGAELQKREFRDYSTEFYFKSGPGLQRFLYNYKEDDDLMHAFFIGYKREFNSWILNLGARYEHYEGYPGKVIPRLGLIYKLNPRWTFLLSYTEGFNIPSFFHKRDWFIPLGTISYTFHKLSPEREKTYQISVLYKRDEDLKLRGTLFYQKQKDRIWYDSVKREEVNFPSFSSAGLELELTGKRGELLYFLNYSYFKLLEAKNQPFIYKEDYIIGFPRWMLKGGISLKLPFYPASYLSPSFKFIGPTRDRGGKIVSDYFVWDLNYRLNLFKNISLEAKIENLFDKHYKRAGSMEAIPWDGRRASLELKLDF
ncbi:MAG: TonB-dependent receptor [Caldimicrobium sp.]